jgi:hypothetical protein
MFDRRNRKVRKASATVFLGEKHSIQRGEQPGFDLCRIAKLSVIRE